MAETFHTLVHGLRVGSDMPLEGMPLGGTEGRPDVNVARTDWIPPIEADAPVILSYAYDSGQTVHAATDDNASTCISFPGVGRFRLSEGLDRVEMWVESAASTDMAAVLLQGWVMSMVIMLRGGTVLHASAVESNGSTVGFLADSGMGKSTLAGMLIRDGARLLSDDVLRVEGRPDNEFVVHPGSTSLRLRPAASELAHSLTGAQVSPTTDGRLSVQFERLNGEPVRLDAVFIPFPSQGATRLEVEWLPPVVAAVELNRYPRVYDWKIEAPVRQHFQVTSALAWSVPVGLLSVPWGPPWPSGLLVDLLALVSATGH